jgi:hypothetical protein
MALQEDMHREGLVVCFIVLPGGGGARLHCRVSLIAMPF